MDEIVEIVRIYKAEPAELLVAFESLTGHQPLVDHETHPTASG